MSRAGPSKQDAFGAAARDEGEASLSRLPAKMQERGASNRPRAAEEAVMQERMGRMRQNRNESDNSMGSLDDYDEYFGSHGDLRHVSSGGDLRHTSSGRSMMRLASESLFDTSVANPHGSYTDLSGLSRPDSLLDLRDDDMGGGRGNRRQSERHQRQVLKELQAGGEGASPTGGGGPLRSSSSLARRCAWRSQTSRPIGRTCCSGR